MSGTKICPTEGVPRGTMPPPRNFGTPIISPKLLDLCGGPHIVSILMIDTTCLILLICYVPRVLVVRKMQVFGSLTVFGPNEKLSYLTVGLPCTAKIRDSFALIGLGHS